MFERRRENGIVPLSGVKVLAEQPCEPVDSMLRRFKKVIQRNEVLVDARKHEHFAPKSERRRLKSLKARKRQRA